MKKLRWSLIAAAALSLGAPFSALASDGYFDFNNYSVYDGTPNSQLPRIGPLSAFGEGPVGAIVGSDATFATPNYSIGFLWREGTADIAGQNFLDFDLNAHAGTRSGYFLAHTGDVANGAGLFSGNGTDTAFIPGSVDGQHITVELIAWYNPNGTTTYDQAVANVFNTGHSSLMDVRIAAGADPVVADLSNMNGFLVGITPEPSAPALAGLGAAAFFLWRRRSRVATP